MITTAPVEQPIYDSSVSVAPSSVVPSSVVVSSDAGSDGGGATYEEPPAPPVPVRVQEVVKSSGPGVQIPWADIAKGFSTAAVAAGTVATPYYQFQTAQTLAQRQQQPQVTPAMMTYTRLPARDDTMLWVAGGVAVLAAVGLAIFAMRR